MADPQKEGQEINRELREAFREYVRARQGEMLAAIKESLESFLRSQMEAR